MRVGSTIAAVACALLAVGSAQARACRSFAERITLDLPGAPSRAEVLRPLGRIVAAAVLLQGSDVADLDSAIVAKGRVVSRPLGDMARALACTGVATLRYDKRSVTGPDTVDRAAFDKLTLQDFAADADRALARLAAIPDLAGKPRFLVGWSEGTVIAADVAARRRDLAGVVLVAPVTPSFADTLQKDWPRTARPYVARYARDGAIDAAGVAAAAKGPGGAVAQMYVGFLKGFTPASTLNADIDRNHDGRIDLATEADPTFKGWFADGPDGGLGIYASSRALPGVASRLDAISAPILVLQGDNDGNIDPASVEGLASGRAGKVTIRRWPDLGHALGPSVSPQEDGLAPPAAAALAAMATWVRSRALGAQP